MTPLSARSPGEAGDEAIEHGHFQSFLDDGGQGQIAGFRSCHRQIVHHAVHGQRPQVAAGELQRLHGKAVGGDHDLAGKTGQQHGIGIGIEHRVGKMSGKDVGDEFAHQAAAVAVRKEDAGFIHGGEIR